MRHTLLPGITRCIMAFNPLGFIKELLTIFTIRIHRSIVNKFRKHRRESHQSLF